MTTIAQPQAAHPAPGASAVRVNEPRGPAYWLSAALAVATAAAAMLTFLLPSVFAGHRRDERFRPGYGAGGPADRGARAGRLDAAGSSKGSAAAVLTWLGTVAFLGYNALMFLFATPVNRLFPLCLAMLALAAWSAGVLLRQADAPALGALFSLRAPVRVSRRTCGL